MGSLGKDTDISDITYRNIYTWNSNNMMFIKSNGGSGSASNLLFENFIGKRILPEKQLMNEESLTLWLTFLVRPR
jgi:hypothetical protein